MTNILRTQNLTKTYQGKEAVNSVNMNIKQGEIYGFLGPNGAGKTTVMKMITNLVKPTYGEIEFFGEKMTERSYEMLKRMGCIIEYPVFYDKLTAKENLILHGEYMGYYDKQAMGEALELVKLTGIDNKPVKQFSLGMKQRLGIARAVMTKPELLILDEPINGLDPLGIKEMREVFRMLSQEYGMTLLISSHLLAEIEQIADTIGVIREGVLLEEVAMQTIRGGNTEYIELITNESSKAVYVLEHKLKLTNFKVMDPRTIRVYDDSISQRELNKALVMEDIELESLSKMNHSLEDYFLNLIGGDGIA
ncbi:ABC transporter ATP-binding protein [Paenibacillus monticola]|uniref:ATP-binding cassette domain-containing protein n=1 Tax=Paenibacillus monticola TaxID=2666075 RepID=A0A7X2H3Y5_9BACL|nr:ABC transporter ATP-binding protein [Paenibacillus monticola]MRN53132.1 ATP-binding cassette domain-containing protein [Paenibacillus monticola]